VEHVVAIANGGEHSYRNVRCACARCAGMKGTRSAEEIKGWIQSWRNSQRDNITPDEPMLLS
jgi:5-methylcytosine-specific restriction endonuclease McrA